MGKVQEEVRRERLDRGIKVRSDSVYAIASLRDMAYLLSPRIIPVVAVFVLPLVLGGYWTKVMVYAAVYGLLALSWDFLASCGLFSLGQALFFGFGAYIAGILSHLLHLSPILTIPL